MSGASTPLRYRGSAAFDGAATENGSRLAGAPRRRRVPYLLVGVLLVVGCTTAGVVVATQLGDRQEVLVLAEPVTVGQRITERDVREVSMALDPSVEVLPKSALAEDPLAAYSLPAGSVLTEDVLGQPATPPDGQAVMAVPLEPGQFPPGLQPGQTVQVMAASAEDAAAETSTVSWTAVVTAVKEAGERGQLAVATLQLDAVDARAVAAWPAEELRLVVIAGGGR